MIAIMVENSIGKVDIFVTLGCYHGCFVLADAIFLRSYQKGTIVLPRCRVVFYVGESPSMTEKFRNLQRASQKSPSSQFTLNLILF